MAFRRLLKLGGMELSLSVSDQLANKIRANPLWAGRHDDPAPPVYPSIATADGHDSPAVERRELLKAVTEMPWYHTINLGNGISTQGRFDHTPYLSHYPIPERLDGMRVLDIATYDGYWAFEFERRGASEVVALDVGCFGDADLPAALRSSSSTKELAEKTGAGFKLASEVLSSKVHREVLNVYDISPERLGTFDFVFCSDLLLHLMCPVKALERIRTVVAGEAMFGDCFNNSLPGNTAEYKGGGYRLVWWSFGYECLFKMISDAGFSEVIPAGKFKMGHRGEKPWMWHAVFKAIS